jgi:hypothetical protein
MAITSGSVLPMRGAGGIGGTAAAITENMISAAAIVVGDVVVASSGLVTPDLSNPAGDTIIGIAQHAVGAAAADITIALALPGQLFEGNMVADADVGTDETAALAAILVEEGLDQDSVSGYMCVDQAGSADCVYVTGFAKQTGPSQQHLGRYVVPTETYAAGSTVNPRVQFVFMASVFHQLA